MLSIRNCCGRNPFYVLKRHGGLTVDSKVLQKLDNVYDKLLNSDSKSLLKKYLTPELFQKLKTKQTGTFTLLDCIQSGLIHHDSVCGIYAACPDSYKVFAELFDPIIQDLHFGFKSVDKQPPVDFGDPDAFEDIDPNMNFIDSVRMQCARSLQGYPFNPCMTFDHYNEIEDKLHCISSGFQDDLEGEYRGLPRLDKTMRSAVVHEHRAFRVDDRFLVAANACQHWPTGRGVFRNFDGTFMVLCNGEDHLCVTSVQTGGNFAEVYARLVRGVQYIEKYLPFERDDRLGFLTFCPTRLGTTLQASVRIRIPKLAANKTVLNDFAQKHKLMIQSTNRDEFYDISNRRRLGLTEIDIISGLYCGVREIIQLEKGEKEPQIVKKKPQPPPPHIDPEKAIKSGMVDDRKKKLSSTKNAPKSLLEKMKTANKSSTTKKIKDVSAGASISKKVPAAGKPQLKAAKTLSIGVRSSNKTMGNQLKVASLKPKNASPTQSAGTIQKNSQSTNPCTRAGIKMPTIKEKIREKSGPSKCALEKKKQVPSNCKTVTPGSSASTRGKVSDSKK